MRYAVMMRLVVLLLVALSWTGCAGPPSLAAVNVGEAPPTARPAPGATLIPVSRTPLPQPAASPTALAATPVYGYRVIRSYPHDRNAFTQGLVYLDGRLYEGTGLNGRSSLRRVDLETGEVLQIRNLDGQYFGEGIALFGRRIYQLTWQNGVGFIYDRDSFEPVGDWRYPPAGRRLPVEGWGLTTDGRQLIMSDGTANLYFLDPETLAISRQVEVRDAAGPLVRLNELEYIEGAVYANIWQTDRVARIDPHNGRVTAYVDLSGLLTPAERAASDVLNGIAYDAGGRRFFVTGKLWPKLFEIELLPPVTGYRLTIPVIRHPS